MYIYLSLSPRLSDQCYFFPPFLQRMDWRFKKKKCCRVWARRRRRAEDEGAFAELCSSVRGAGRPCPPARPLAAPPAVATAAAAAAAPWPRPPRAPAASPRRPPARVPGERWSGVGPVCLPPAPSPESRSPAEREGGQGAGGGGGRIAAAARPSPAGTATQRAAASGRAGTHADCPAGRRPSAPVRARGGATGNERATSLPRPPSLGEFR